jgi:NAD(P)-dependent dehydrogenase (short-subunit alcohol dehydrogenase family)
MRDKFDVKDKVIVISGSSGVMGQQYAEGLAQLGANLVLVDKKIDKSKLFVKNFSKEFKNKHIVIKTDLTSRSSIKSMVSKIIKKFGRIDVFINNAAFQEGKNERCVPFEQLSMQSWNNVLSVNLTGTMMCCQEIGKIMKKQHSGSIINISSIYGLIGADQRIYGKSGLNSSVSYAATKGAIINMTRYLAAYWQNTGIRVNSLSLGGVKNNQDPEFIKQYSKKTMIGRMGYKEEFVGAIIFLSSNASSYMTGSNLIIDGGWTAW